MNEDEMIVKQSIQAGDSVKMIAERWTGTVSEIDGETAKIVLDAQYENQQEFLNPGKGFLDVSLLEIERVF